MKSTVLLAILPCLFLVAVATTTTTTTAGPDAAGGYTDCRPDGLNIRCTKRGYESHTLTVNNKLTCTDGSHCQAIYYNIAVYYGRCGRQGKNVKSYGNRFLRPYEGYSYHFFKASRNRCLEYVIHTCSKNERQTQIVNCNTAFDITVY